VAAFTKKIFDAQIGWVELEESPLSGAWLAPHAVQVHRIDGLAGLADSIQLESGAIQAVALAVEDDVEVAPRLRAMGATRICRPGELQVPDASWPHDGLPNFTSMLLPEVS